MKEKQMALIKCTGCASDFSDSYKFCPNCGKPTHLQTQDPQNTNEVSNSDQGIKLKHIKELLESAFSTNEGFNGENNLRELNDRLSSELSRDINDPLLMTMQILTRYFVNQIDSIDFHEKEILDLKVEKLKLVYDFHGPLVVACLCNFAGFGVFNIASKIKDKGKFINLVNTRFTFIKDMINRLSELKTQFGVALKNNIELANEQRIWIESFKLIDKDRCSPFRFNEQYLYVDNCFNMNIREINKKLGYAIPLIWIKT
jgi:hypothetical protein